MSQPQPQPAPDRVAAVEMICVECGETIRVADPEGLIRAAHLRNECTVSGLLGAPQPD
jgi:hypothetical protein